MNLTQEQIRRLRPPPTDRRPHVHGLSRRQMIGGMAGAAGLALGAGWWRPTPAHARGSIAPRPIPEVAAPGLPFHVEFPVEGNEPATITDFDGFVGVGDIVGTGKDETGTVLYFEADMRFMHGVYVGVDGRRHFGTFGFV